MQQAPADTPLGYFNHPFIDRDEWRTEPTPHRYVHGGFSGNNTRFSIYLPPEADYEGRFFQYVTPVPTSEHLCTGLTGEEDRIGFAFASGGYFIETNGGGALFEGLGDPHPLVPAFEANAAAAEFSRALASEWYGEHRAFGYLFGGSGGGYRTLAAAENAAGVWDGFVPYVIGSPVALPNVFSVRMHAQRVLADKLDDIVDALEPGGSGDPYASLDAEEADAFREVSAMGFPKRAWFGHRGLGTQAFAVIRAPMRLADRSYFEDFWQVPGYEGTDPASSVHRHRVRHETTILALLDQDELAALDLPELPHLRRRRRREGVDESFRAGSNDDLPVVAAIRLAEAPGTNTQGAELSFTSGAAAGTKVALRLIIGDLAVLDADNASVGWSSLAAGDGIRIDNSDFLAAQTYHRHQVPADTSFRVWDQFRDDEGGPLGPQRPAAIGPLLARGATGRPLTGRIHGRMIVVASLLDREAYPWQASWYADRVRDHLGEGTQDAFRLWFTDNAVHGDVTDQGDPTHIVSYVGTLHCALRALVEWVEHGIDPAPSTTHRVVDGQVVVPSDAAQRGGVQPVITLSATTHTNSSEGRIDVALGTDVALLARADVPGTGEFVSIQWDLDGDGDFEVSLDVAPVAHLEAAETTSFTRPGTYFVTVRAVAQREGNPDDPFARVGNLARLRVAVRP